jgi:hypothetical protein
VEVDVLHYREGRTATHVADFYSDGVAGITFRVRIMRPRGLKGSITDHAALMTHLAKPEQSPPPQQFRQFDDVRGDPARLAHRADLTVQERAEHIAARVKLTETKPDAAQLAPHRKAGQQSGGINAAVRELGIERTEAQRAVKIASMADEAKVAAREAGLADNQSALLAVAREPTPEAQCLFHLPIIAIAGEHTGSIIPLVALRCGSGPGLIRSAPGYAGRLCPAWLAGGIGRHAKAPGRETVPALIYANLASVGRPDK